jgi:isopentenyl phosphate kinase
VPLIFGDTVLDDQLGGTICSTEDLFLHLSKSLPPARVLLAGIEPAVWADFPARQVKLAVIHASESLNANNKISGSIFTDVTGGMAAKVQKMAALVQQYPKCEVLLFSGIAPGAILAALSGNYPGTAILP